VLRFVFLIGDFLCPREEYFLECKFLAESKIVDEEKRNTKKNGYS
jgi:hypothetical protein